MSRLEFLRFPVQVWVHCVRTLLEAVGRLQKKEPGKRALRLLRSRLCCYFFAAHGLHGLHGLHGFLAAHGLHGLHAFAAQGLQGLHALAAQGLQGLHALAAHGLQGLQALAAQGLHGLQGLLFAAHGLKPACSSSE